MRTKPASPAKRAIPLAVNRTPLSDDVAAPPTPVPGAPDGTIAGWMFGVVVAGWGEGRGGRQGGRCTFVFRGGRRRSHCGRGVPARSGGGRSDGNLRGCGARGGGNGSGGGGAGESVGRG